MSQSQPAMFALFLAVTMLGNASVLTAVVLVIYWCIDRVRGVRAGIVLFTSMWLNLALKLVFKLPRPAPSVSHGIIASLIDMEGYGFPSGHTQWVATLWLTLATLFRSRALAMAGALLTPLVGFSRICLRAHYPADVAGGALLGIAAASVAAAYLSWWDRHEFRLDPPYALGLSIVASLAMLLGPVDSQVAKSVGFLMGFSSGSVVERWIGEIHRPGTAVSSAARVIAGAAAVFGVSLLLKVRPPETLFWTFLRYALMGTAATVIAPAMFVVLRVAGQGGRVR